MFLDQFPVSLDRPFHCKQTGPFLLSLLSLMLSILPTLPSLQDWNISLVLLHSSPRKCSGLSRLGGGKLSGPPFALLATTSLLCSPSLHSQVSPKEELYELLPFIHSLAQSSQASASCNCSIQVTRNFLNGTPVDVFWFCVA